jgi:hypothetical protein
VIWDRGNNHKGPLIREFLTRNRRLHLERLPAWAPGHNPAESVWNWLKWGVLANFTPEGVEYLNDAIIDRLVELRHNPGLLRTLWHRCELPFPTKEI